MTDSKPEAIKLPSGRNVTGYHFVSARAVADGSHAQMMYFVEDAKKDIAYLAALAEDLRRQFETADKLRVFWNDKAAALAHPGQVREIAIKPLEDAVRIYLEALDGEPEKDVMDEDNVSFASDWSHRKHDAEIVMALDAVRSALALPLPVQEKPVAWRKDYSDEFHKFPPEFCDDPQLAESWRGHPSGFIVTPLFAAAPSTVPEAQGTPEPVSRRVFEPYPGAFDEILGPAPEGSTDE